MSSEAASALRAKQKPLKDKYRSDPSSALVTLSTSGTLEQSAPLTCSLSAAGAAKKLAGLHSAAGGAGFDATGELCSGDMLLESLVACFGVTIRAVATAMSIPLNGGSLTCEGDLDFRGTLGIKDADGEAPPVGFKSIRLFVRLDVDDEHKDSVPKLVELSQRYCVVLQTLKGGVDVEMNLGHVGSIMPAARSDGEKDVTVNGAGNAVHDTSAGGAESVLPLNT